MTTKLQDHIFTISAGQEIVDGKSHYPDLVRLMIPTEQALDFALNVLTNLKNRRPGEDMLFEIALFGKLEPLDENGEVIRRKDPL